jgi:hypothetical protein
MFFYKFNNYLVISVISFLILLIDYCAVGTSIFIDIQVNKDPSYADIPFYLFPQDIHGNKSLSGLPVRWNY